MVVCQDEEEEARRPSVEEERSSEDARDHHWKVYLCWVVVSIAHYSLEIVISVLQTRRLGNDR